MHPQSDYCKQKDRGKHSGYTTHLGSFERFEELGPLALVSSEHIVVVQIVLEVKQALKGGNSFQPIQELVGFHTYLRKSNLGEQQTVGPEIDLKICFAEEQIRFLGPGGQSS